MVNVKRLHATQLKINFAVKPIMVSLHAICNDFMWKMNIILQLDYQYDPYSRMMSIDCQINVLFFLQIINNFVIT